LILQRLRAFAVAPVAEGACLRKLYEMLLVAAQHLAKYFLALGAEKRRAPRLAQQRF
jgi:hypothetical protein